MAKETKPDYSYKWASGGDVATPTTGKISLGWVVEKPSVQMWNFIENRQDQALAYLFQQGVTEWDATTNYQAGSSFVSHDGRLYLASQSSTNKEPSLEPTYWNVHGKTFVAAPSTSSSTGVSGQWAVDSDYIYVCVATNTWKRSALSTW